MKIHQFAMIIATVVMLGGTVMADEKPDDRLFGNGRFLRRIRSELTGRPEPTKPQPGKPPARSNPLDPRAKVPTPAARPGANSPAPARSNGNLIAPKLPPATRLTPPSINGNRPKTIGSGLANPNSAARGAEPTPTSTLVGDAEKSSQKPTLGFGMLLQKRGEELVVAQLDPRGNAVEAGVRGGDVIVGAGGVALSSMNEFNEITDILQNGDQLEFEIARRGKKDKMLIQFGEAPKEGEITKPAPGPNPAIDKATTNNSELGRARRVQPLPGAYDFVPPASGTNGMRSVLDQGERSNATSLRSFTNPRATQNRNAAASPQLIEQQRRQIEQMQREIERLRQLQQIQPAESGSLGGSILNGPDGN